MNIMKRIRSRKAKATFALALAVSGGGAGLVSSGVAEAGIRNCSANYANLQHSGGGSYGRSFCEYTSTNSGQHSVRVHCTDNSYNYGPWVGGGKASYAYCAGSARADAVLVRVRYP